MSTTVTSEPSLIAPNALFERIRRGESVDIIDVRTPAEFREIHIEKARNMPLDSLDVETLKANGLGTDDRPLYVVCRSGSRASKACEKLIGSGLTNVVNIEGGTLAWEAAGLPVRRGKKTISLERQVRIAAGFLVLLGVVFGFAIHPAFFGLSGFVGAGLMFAGITDTCAMGMLIARMPWNQVKTCDSSAIQKATSDSHVTGGGTCRT